MAAPRRVVVGPPCPCEGMACRLGEVDAAHGSRYGYKLKCRCVPCRDAQADGSFDWASANRDRKRELNRESKARAAANLRRARELAAELELAA